MTIVFSFASVIGPSAGGYLTDNLSWHWVFFINVPLGIVIIGIFAKYFPNLRNTKIKHTLDYSGLCTLVLTVAPIMLALS